MTTSGCEVELSSSPLHRPEALVSHANAALTPRARLRLAQLVVEEKWTYQTAAKMFMVAPRTAKKWADRYRAEGAAGMADRSSRPHSSPTKTPPQLVRQIVRLRWRHRLGPVQIAGRLGLQASTVHAVLVRCRINRLSHIDRVTGEPLRRYAATSTHTPAR
jgi:DNA-directed RNA polymerase specialized sigma24 family protein